MPAPDAGTRPVLRRTREAIEDIFGLFAVGRSVDEICDSLGILPDELLACFAYARDITANRMMQRANPGDAKVHASLRELKKAFHRHRDAGTNNVESNDSHLLLLIYAIECGLKALLLNSRKVHSTERLDRDDFTHDLDELLRLLGQAPRFGPITLEPNVNVPPLRLHEALRYGRRLSQGSRQKVSTAVNHVIDFIEENL